MIAEVLETYKTRAYAEVQRKAFERTINILNMNDVLSIEVEENAAGMWEVVLLRQFNSHRP